MDDEKAATTLRDIAKWGYAVLENVIDEAEVATIRADVCRIAAHEADAGTAWVSNGNQRVFALVNKGQRFIDLAMHSGVMNVVEELLTVNVLLSSITAHVVLPGNVAQAIHTDQAYIWEPWPQSLVINALWVLDEFNEQTGGTVIYPGTHTLGVGPSANLAERESTIVNAAPGSVVMLDGRVWHGSGKNRTEDTSRISILAYYCAPFLRQQENHFRSIAPEVRRNLTPRLRTLLGYDIWNGLGVVGGLPVEWMGRVGERSGPTNADQIFPEPEA